MSAVAISAVGIGVAWGVMTAMAFAALSASRLLRRPGREPHGEALGQPRSHPQHTEAQAQWPTQAQWPALTVAPRSAVLNCSPSVRMHAGTPQPLLRRS